MAARSKITVCLVKYAFPLAALLASPILAEQVKLVKEDNDKVSASLSAPRLPVSPVTEKPPHPEHVKIAGNHMVKLHQDLKRFPTRAEFVKHLEKEMKITEAQAEKILVEMDID